MPQETPVSDSERIEALEAKISELAGIVRELAWAVAENPDNPEWSLGEISRQAGNLM